MWGGGGGVKTDGAIFVWLVKQPYKCIEINEQYCELLMLSRHEKGGFSLRGNKGEDQLCSNHTADQCLCFCYIDSRGS